MVARKRTSSDAGLASPLTNPPESGMEANPSAKKNLMLTMGDTGTSSSDQVGSVPPLPPAYVKLRDSKKSKVSQSQKVTEKVPSKEAASPVEGRKNQ